MKSIGDVLKQIPTSAHKAKAEKKIKKLMTNPLVIQLISNYPELTDYDLRTNINKLYQYVTEYGHCTHCPGLEQCPNDFAGHYTRLSIDNLNGYNYVYDRKIPCKKFLAYKHQRAVQDRVRSFYVDEIALKRGYSASEILENDMERSSAVLNIIEYIERTKRQGLVPKGMYLVGSFGTGKTFLISYVLYELARANYTGVIVYMPEFVEDLKSMFQEPQKLRETIEVMKESDLLVFDDIGAENITPWVRDHVLGSILNYRMNRKPTFYTSNYDLDALQKHFSYTREGEDIHRAKRLIDRIIPFVSIVHVLGRNKRGNAQ